MMQNGQAVQLVAHPHGWTASLLLIALCCDFETTWCRRFFSVSILPVINILVHKGRTLDLLSRLTNDQFSYSLYGKCQTNDSCLVTTQGLRFFSKNKCSEWLNHKYKNNKFMISLLDKIQMLLWPGNDQSERIMSCKVTIA